jgi:FAD/FMN-containing dehydrogenase
MAAAESGAERGRMADSNAVRQIQSSLARIVGDGNCLLDAQEMAPYSEDWRRLRQGAPLAVVLPGSTEEVSAVVRLCAQKRIGIVPQGGNTGLVAGATPGSAGNEIVMALARMNRIRELDPINLTLTAEAGVTLLAAQEAATEAACQLPLSMASEGTAQIGGALSTNAGGNKTVRYGNARELVLGLEVVLADGEIWHGLRRLRKDNAGYCLRQLFVGAEGTLGIVTAAVLKLVPRPQDVAVAFCAVGSEQAALELYLLCRERYSSAIQAFEYMCGAGIDLVLRNIPGTELPLTHPAAHYVLVELADGASAGGGGGMREALEGLLESAMERGLVEDAALAGSTSERAALWRLREEQSEAQAREPAAVKHDVSVPVSRVAEFLGRAREVCEQQFAGVRVVPFGHMGDGNIHFNLLPAAGGDASAFLKDSEAMAEAVYAVVQAMEGSFSAEHGVGSLKPGMLEAWRGGAELATMRRIKAALDPLGIMNPGKVLPPEPSP